MGKSIRLKMRPRHQTIIILRCYQFYTIFSSHNLIVLVNHFLYVQSFRLFFVILNYLVPRRIVSLFFCNIHTSDPGPFLVQSVRASVNSEIWYFCLSMYIFIHIQSESFELSLIKNYCQWPIFCQISLDIKQCWTCVKSRPILFKIFLVVITFNFHIIKYVIILRYTTDKCNHNILIFIPLINGPHHRQRKISWVRQSTYWAIWLK